MLRNIAWIKKFVKLKSFFANSHSFFKCCKKQSKLETSDKLKISHLVSRSFPLPSSAQLVSPQYWYCESIIQSQVITKFEENQGTKNSWFTHLTCICQFSTMSWDRILSVLQNCEYFQCLGLIVSFFHIFWTMFLCKIGKISVLNTKEA